MSTRYGVSDPEQRASGLRHAADALARGELVVLPTDTVYGVAADAFSPEAVTALLAAKGRGRAMPPPVLVADLRTLDGLARDVPPRARELAEACWPGALTLVVLAQPSLRWDLGETRGTVAVRVPDHPLTRELLARTGPLAVTSANRTGQPAATDAAGAQEQLGAAVAVYLDDGVVTGADARGADAGGTGPQQARPSTIVDATSDVLRVVRAGALSLARLREVVPSVLDEHGRGAEQHGRRAVEQSDEAPATTPTTGAPA